MQRLDAVVAVERGVKLSRGSDGCGIASSFLITVAGGLLLLWTHSREDGDRGFADGVGGLELVAVGELEIELVGGNLHGLAAGLTAAAGLTRLGVLHHARIVDHVKPQGLVLVVEVKHKPVGRTMRIAGAVRLEFGAAREDRLLDGVVRAHVYIAARAANVNHGWAAALDVDIAFHDGVVHRVVSFKEHGAFIGGQRPVRLFQTNVLQRGLPGRLLNCAAASRDHRRMLASSHDMNIGLQQKLIAVGIVVRPFGRAAGLGGAKLHQFFGMRDARLLVEGQGAGHQVNRVLQLIGRGLVGLLRALGVPLKIDMHFANRGDIAVLRIVGELIAINLVIPVVLVPVHDDVNIAQIGVAAGFELHRLGGPDGVKSAAAFGLGKREPIAGLLDVNAQLRGHVVQHGADAVAGNPVRHADGSHQHQQAAHQPCAHVSYRLEHLYRYYASGSDR